MKLLNLIFIFLLLVLTCSQQSSFAQNTMTSDVLEIRNKIETDVQKNIQQLVATKLDPHSFTVAVRVMLSPIQPPKPEEKKPKEELPAGMDIGSIDVRNLVDSYEKQIEELKLKQNAKKDQPNQFQLKSLEVIVGLDKSYGEEYQKTFAGWLKNKMHADYGSISSATVNLVEFNNPEQNQNNSDTSDEPKPEEPYSLLKNIAPIAAALLVLIGLFALGLFIYSGMKKLATTQQNIALESRSKWQLEQSNFANEEAEKIEDAVADPLALEHLNSTDFERLISKIAFVCLELTDGLNDLVRVWTDSGDEGFLKAALLIDTLVNAREKIMSQTGAMTQIRFHIDHDIIKQREESFSEAFRNVAKMMTQEKVVLLEQIYWDLVSCRTIGLQSLRRPFDFLHGMNKENVIELLKTQKDEAKALAIVYLPNDIQLEVINAFEEDKKVDLIKKMLIQSQISQKEIWDLDTSVKVATINQSAFPEEKLVNLFPRTVEVLETLNPLDEIKILRQISPQLPDSGLILKQQYSSLSFIDEWKSDYIKKLIGTATSDEILALIKQIPSAQELILEQCSEKLRMIVQDDLSLKSSVDQTVVTQKLASLKAKWNRIIVNENLPMSKVLDVRKREVQQHAA